MFTLEEVRPEALDVGFEYDLWSMVVLGSSGWMCEAIVVGDCLAGPGLRESKLVY